MTNSEKFRPGSAIASGWILILFFFGFIVQTLIYGGDIAVTVGVCGAGAIGAYLLFLKPYVLIFDEGLKIINPSKEISATWDLIDAIETKYTMSILVRGVTYFAWAAPAPSGRHIRRMNRSEPFHGADTPRRVGDSLESDSGVCAHIARLRKKSFVQSGPSGLQVSSDFNGAYIAAAFGVFAIASALL